MTPEQRKVQTFHETMGATVGKSPGIRDAELRAKLILEEAVETCAALGFAAYGAIHDPNAPDPCGEEPVASFYRISKKPNLVEFIDGLCDLWYVLLGTAVAAGIDLEPHFDEVHRANMAKLGGGKRADGKVQKPHDWEPPDHLSILAGEHL